MINEILLSLVMACSFVVESERESCQAYAPTCYYLESQHTRNLDIIEAKCYQRIREIYEFVE